MARSRSPAPMWLESADLTPAAAAAVFMVPANSVHMCGRACAPAGGHVKESMSKCAGIKTYSIWT